MKILLVNSRYPPGVTGGSGKSVQALAEGLGRQGHRPIVVTLTSDSSMSTRNQNGVTVHTLPLKNVYWPFDRDPSAIRKAVWHGLDAYNPFMRRGFRDVLEEERPDLVHTNVIAGFSAAVWSVVQSAACPLVHTLRDYYLMCPRSTMFRRGNNCDSICWDCRGFSLVRRRLSRRIDTVVSNSRAVLDRHRSHGYFEDTPARVIHNAYQEPTGTADSSCGSSDTFTIGYLGRLHETKGVAFMLESLRGNLRPGWTVKVAGAGDQHYERKLRERFRGPDIDFPGFVDASEYLPTLDVLVVPSLWEDPLPRVIFEAFHFGVPVIGTRRGGIPEAISDGETGLLFDPEQPDELIHCLDRLDRDDEFRRDMGRRAQKAAEHFLEDRMVDEYEACYRDVLDR